MNLTPTTTEIHERHHWFELTGEQIKALLIEGAIGSVGAEPYEIKLTTSSPLPSVSISITEQLTTSQPISSAHVTTPKPPPALAKTVISSPESTTPKTQIGDAWTEAENELVVRRAVELRHMSRQAAAVMIAEDLPHRTAKAIMLRMAGALRGRIEAVQGATYLKADTKRAPEAVSATVEPARTITPEKSPEATPAPAKRADGPSETAPVAKVGDAGFPVIGDLPPWQRNLRAALNALGYAGGWSPKDDAQLVELHATGWKLGDIADLQSRTIDEVKGRWFALVAAVTGGSGTALTLSEREQLGVETRDRADFVGVTHAEGATA